MCGLLSMQDPSVTGTWLRGQDPREPLRGAGRIRGGTSADGSWLRSRDHTALGGIPILLENSLSQELKMQGVKERASKISGEENKGVCAHHMFPVGDPRAPPSRGWFVSGLERKQQDWGVWRRVLGHCPRRQRRLQRRCRFQAQVT